MTALPATVQFENTAIRIVDRDDRPWLVGADIARALGYERSDKIGQLYSRRKDEFTDEMTQVVEIDTPIPDNLKNGVSGNLRPRTKVRIYSTRGAHLLAMFADTVKAKAFRRWVLDVLEQKLAEKPEPVVVERPETARASKRRLATAQSRPGTVVVRAEIERVVIFYPKFGLPTLRITGQSNLGAIGIEETMPEDFDKVIRALVDRHAMRAG